MSAPLPLPPLTAKTQSAIAPELVNTNSDLLIESAIEALVEKNLSTPCIERRRSLISLSKSVEMQTQYLAEAEANPAQWVSDWVWTSDPRRNPSVLPFDLFPKQAEYLHWRRERRLAKEHGLIEKSRDAGLTWLNCCAGIHAWLFEPGYKGTVGSRKEMLVDRIGDPDCIFEKMRYILRYLPEWMKPATNEYSDGSLKLINHRNGASITGEAGDNMGRGGRSTVYDIDEAAFIERASRVDAAVSQNTEVVFYTSTPNGPGNPFAQKRQSGKIAIFTFHWLDDPRKNAWELRDRAGEIIQSGRGRGAPKGAIYPWYQKQVDRLDPVIVAQEIDIDYNASIEGVTIPHAWVMAAVELSLPARGAVVAGLDIADEGVDLNVFVAHKGPLVTAIESWAEGDTTQTAYKSRDLGKTLGISHLNYDAIGIGAGVGGTLKNCDRLPFTIEGINGGSSPSEKEWTTFDDKTSKEIFRNLRAELWWLMRRRFEKTHEYVNGIAEHPVDELISIPNHSTLISQLSQPLRKYNDSGKIVIESKADMAKRGIKSPDFADALVYAFAEPPPKPQIKRSGMKLY